MWLVTWLVGALLTLYLSPSIWRIPLTSCIRRLYVASLQGKHIGWYFFNPKLLCYCIVFLLLCITLLNAHIHVYIQCIQRLFRLLIFIFILMLSSRPSGFSLSIEQVSASPALPIPFPVDINITRLHGIHHMGCTHKEALEGWKMTNWKKNWDRNQTLVLLTRVRAVG